MASIEQGLRTPIGRARILDQLVLRRDYDAIPEHLPLGEIRRTGESSSSSPTPADWRSLWTAHSSEPVPPVDFARLLVVGVFLGTRPTAGFDVEVTGATIRGDEAVVRFVEQRPAPDAVLAQVVTSPYHFVLLPAGLRLVTLEQVDPSR